MKGNDFIRFTFLRRDLLTKKNCIADKKNILVLCFFFFSGKYHGKLISVVISDAQCDALSSYTAFYVYSRFLNLFRLTLPEVQEKMT